MELKVVIWNNRLSNKDRGKLKKKLQSDYCAIKDHSKEERGFDCRMMGSSCLVHVCSASYH